MRLTNELEVAAPLRRTWDAWLDVPRLARALPGASISPDVIDGAHRGTLEVRLGPVGAEYAGTVRLEDVDEDARMASLRFLGREARGQGTVAATVTSRLTPADGRTRVVVETDLHVTGGHARLGREVFEEVAGALLGELAAGLERQLTGLAEPETAPLDLGAAGAGALRRRAGLIGVGMAAGLGLGLVLGRLLWGRR
jgi:uncharacterized protein